MDGAARTPALVRLIQDNLRLMRQRQRLQEDEPYVTLQVGRQVFESAPRSMRVELWKSSLQRRGSGVAAARSYADLCAHGAVAGEAGDDIDKDLGRTFPGTRRFAGAEGQAALRRVLRAYAALDPEVGYCQGMNFVAALLLSYLPEPQAFGALVVLMEDRGLRRYYSPDMGLLQMIESHWRVLTWRVCTRSSLACGGIHLIKLGVKRLARGRPRVAKAVDYVCDVLLPTGCYGLLLGVSLVAVQSVHELLAAPELPDPQ
ncbi:hypothetical protein Rsub_00563 [Raphidocelis subcapitata]|uniref:Rab-GAP TBC domain-containing protein n=1 Tax=Raphidocelis subcapitata TaxID=307507 RepID=A0A2V0NKK0_9CHLO|nr:hypothetical protein Rsub_00563 [Raphidocelis subcapitata]|eukprot:GBF87851.1 hypothetical protein Rsub_00563 [Raphidocelis subcapitata]